MGKFILTGCNSGRNLSKFSLVYFDFSLKSFQSIVIPTKFLIDKEFIGFTGIEKIGNKYYVAVQCFPKSKILVLDIECNVINVINFEKNYDLHTLSSQNHLLYITLTLENRIVIYNTESNEFSDEWKSSSPELHLNTYKIIEGKRLALMHNSFLNDFGSGSLINLDEKIELIKNLEQPHDIFYFKHFVFVSSSIKGQCFRLNLRNNKVKLYRKFDGYLRGIYIDDEIEVFSISAQRLFSRKKGVGEKQVKIHENYYVDEKFESFLYIFDKKNNTEEKINTTAIFDEIYDVLKIEIAPKNIYSQSTELLRIKAFKKRINTIELELKKLREQIQNPI